jgi:ribose transport system permease protein
MLSDPGASSLQNHQNLGRRLGSWGVITVGVGFVIITGGIDLSIGSVVCLGAVILSLLLEKQVNPLLAILVVLAVAGFIGLFHGLLITRLGLQPFIVTLCGLFIYRGLAKWATLINFDVLFARFTGQSTTARLMRDSSRDVGIGGRNDLDAYSFLAKGNLFGVPMTIVLLAGIAVLAAILLHRSVYGRYLYAIGYNEQAARYAGIATSRYRILAYVLCSLLAGLGGVLFLFDVGSVSPSSAGNWYELYAITGAVLGGFSLRGGEGTIPGVLLGTAILPLLSNLCIFADVPSDLEYTFIGVALLLGTIVDELFKRRAARVG